MITRTTCGSTITRKICPVRRPSVFPASICPASTVFRPERMISAMYADSLIESVSQAARNGVNQASRRLGISCGSAFHTKSNWSRVGIARKIQTHPIATIRGSEVRERPAGRPPARAPPRWPGPRAATAIATPAPRAYASEVSASQKMPQSKLMAGAPRLRQAGVAAGVASLAPNSRVNSAPAAGRFQVVAMLARVPSVAHLLDRVADRGAKRGRILAVVNGEGLGIRIGVGDREHARLRLLAEGDLGVLRDRGVGPADHQLLVGIGLLRVGLDRDPVLARVAAAPGRALPSSSGSWCRIGRRRSCR